MPPQLLPLAVDLADVDPPADQRLQGGGLAKAEKMAEAAASELTVT
jgi:hypothetical protein